MNDVTKPSILVVDDTPENLNLLKNILTNAGYTVRALPHGTEADETDPQFPQFRPLSENVPVRILLLSHVHAY